MSDLQILRMNILGGMNEYMRELGDEDLLDVWLADCIPDECDEDTLMEIAEDKNLFKEICYCFAKDILCNSND